MVTMPAEVTVAGPEIHLKVTLRFELVEAEAEIEYGDTP